jgi:transcriptional regulator with GAF, ATPase, and Fis domain
MTLLSSASENWLGVSDDIQSDALAKIATSCAHVRITGTPDHARLIAHAIHAQSPRAKHRLVWCVCEEGLPEPLVHSELFGHLAGAFAGAFRAYPGRIRLADHGTLIIVGAQRLGLKLRDAIETFAATGDVWPVGATSPIGHADVRIVEVFESAITSPAATTPGPRDRAH